jgi:hypothetical protein
MTGSMREVASGLTEAHAVRFAGAALGHVTKEYPNHLSHALAGPGDAGTPRALHPVFYGSYDWHSCVHAYWMLAYLLRRFPTMAPATEIEALFDTHLVAGAVAGECAYLARPLSRGFERPYGWAWVLKLDLALRAVPERRWADALAPLTTMVVDRFKAFLPLARYPVRTGTHFNTAFALALAAEYAGEDPALLALVRTSATRWYGADQDCQAWEPGQDEFLSPALMEAECMRRVLPPDAFNGWLAGFLPGIAEGQPATLFAPPDVTDRSDGKIAHLDGLSLSRAWCWRSLARTVDAGDPRRPAMIAAAEAHLAAALPHVTGDYMGEHWLASFAVLALEG